MHIVIIILVFALTLYALLDYVRTPDESIPARMPKYLWITLVALFPTIGSIAWIIFPRVKAAEECGGCVEPTVWSSKGGMTFRRPQRPRPMTPGGDPEFFRSLEQGIRHRKHHPQEYAGTPDTSNDGANEDPKAGEMGGTDCPGTDSH